MPDLSQEREALAVDIIKILRAHDHQAFLVGGCVRDRLWHIAPKDFDVSTDARPEQIEAFFPGAQLVGAKFGVVLVRRSNDVCVEVATFRSEGKYSDGRHPEQVRFVLAEVQHLHHLVQLLTTVCREIFPETALL